MNKKGGYFQPGRMYQLPKKIEVAEIYLGLLEVSYPTHPTIKEVANLGKVSWHIVNQVILELKVSGAVQDPESL
jgi:hypothetical protein